MLLSLTRSSGTPDSPFPSAHSTFHHSIVPPRLLPLAPLSGPFPFIPNTFLLACDQGTPLQVVVQLLNHVGLFATPRIAARQASLSFTISMSLLKFRSIELTMPSNHLILCHPLLLLPSVLLNIRVFSNESALHNKWPKDWNFSCSITPSNEYSELISFRMDWFDLLPVQGTLKSFLQTEDAGRAVSQVEGLGGSPISQHQDSCCPLYFRFWVPSGRRWGLTASWCEVVPE